MRRNGESASVGTSRKSKPRHIEENKKGANKNPSKFNKCLLFVLFAILLSAAAVAALPNDDRGLSADTSPYGEIFPTGRSGLPLNAKDSGDFTMNSGFIYKITVAGGKGIGGSYFNEGGNGAAITVWHRIGIETTWNYSTVSGGDATEAWSSLKGVGGKAMYLKDESSNTLIAAGGGGGGTYRTYGGAAGMPTAPGIVSPGANGNPDGDAKAGKGGTATQGGEGGASPNGLIGGKGGGIGTGTGGAGVFGGGGGGGGYTGGGGGSGINQYMAEAQTMWTEMSGGGGGSSYISNAFTYGSAVANTGGEYITVTEYYAYGVSGKVTDTGNNPVSGVTISYTINGVPGTTTTGSNGMYAVAVLESQLDASVMITDVSHELYVLNEDVRPLPAGPFNVSGTNKIHSGVDFEMFPPSILTEGNHQNGIISYSLDNGGVWDTLTGNVQVRVNSSVMLKADSTSPAYAFSHWTVNSNTAGNTNPMTVMMDSNKTIGAAFKESTNYLIYPEGPNFTVKRVIGPLTFDIPSGNNVPIQDAIDAIRADSNGNADSITFDGNTDNWDLQHIGTPDYSGTVLNVGINNITFNGAGTGFTATLYGAITSSYNDSFNKYFIYIENGAALTTYANITASSLNVTAIRAESSDLNIMGGKVTANINNSNGTVYARSSDVIIADGIVETTGEGFAIRSVTNKITLSGNSEIKTNGATAMSVEYLDLDGSPSVTGSITTSVDHIRVIDPDTFNPGSKVYVLSLPNSINDGDIAVKNGADFIDNFKLHENMPDFSLRASGDDLVLATNYVVSGTVTYVSKGLSGVVIAYETDGVPGTITTDKDGKYEIPVLSGSSFKVTGVTKAGFEVNEQIPYQISINANITQNFTMSLVEGNVAVEITIIGDGTVDWICGPLSGSTGVSEIVSVPANATVKFTQSADEGNVFTGWTIGNTVFNQPAKSLDTSENTAITATFTDNDGSWIAIKIGINYDGDSETPMSITWKYGDNVEGTFDFDHYNPSGDTVIYAPLNEVIKFTNSAGSGDVVFSHWTMPTELFQQSAEILVESLGPEQQMAVSGTFLDADDAIKVDISFGGTGTGTVKWYKAGTVVGETNEPTFFYFPALDIGELSVKAIADGDSKFAYWTVDSNVREMSETYQFTAGKGDTVLEALFVDGDTRYDIKIDVKGTGTVSGEDTQVNVDVASVPIHEDETLTFTAAAGWKVGSIKIDGILLIPNTSVGLVIVDDRVWTYIFTDVVEDHDVEVEFIVDTSTHYAVSIEFNQTAGSNNSIKYSVANGSEQTIYEKTVLAVPIGNELKLTAVPAADQAFMHWTSDSGTSILFTKTITDADTVTGTFADNPDGQYSVVEIIFNAVNSNAAGTIGWSCSRDTGTLTSGSVTFSISTDATVTTTAVTTDKNVFLGWRVSGIPDVKAQASMKTTVASNTTITGNFYDNTDETYRILDLKMRPSGVNNSAIWAYYDTTLGVNVDGTAFGNIKIPFSKDRQMNLTVGTLSTHRFMYWSGDISNLTLLTSASTRVYAGTVNVSLTANFDLIATLITITVNKTANLGTVSASVEETPIFSLNATEISGTFQVAPDTPVTFTSAAVPVLGMFDHWVLNGLSTDVCSSITVWVDDAYTMGAVFYAASDLSTVTVSISGTGTVAVSYLDGTLPVNKEVTGEGGIVTVPKNVLITFTGSAGFSHWTVDTVTHVGTYAVSLTDDLDILATFYLGDGSDGSYTISITIEGKGTVSLTFEDKDGNPVTKSRDTTGQLVVYGGDVSFKAEGNATEGYTFSRWFGAFQDTISQKTFEVDDNISITAKFVGTGIGGSYTITVDVTGSGSVTVTINGIEFDYVEPMIVESGAEISFKATPTGTTMFSHWVITGDQNPILYNPYPNNGTIAIDSDMFVNAYFVASGTEYTITPSVKNNQGGTTDPAVPTSVSLGGSLTITFSNDSGWHIVAIVVDGGQRQIWTDLFFTFEDVISNHTIEVEFESDPYIYAHAGDNGTIDPYGNVTVTAGSVPEFRITADRGYTIDVVTVIIDNNPETSGTLSGSGRDWTYTFDPIENNRIYEIYVTFKIDTSLYYAVTVTADAGGDASITTNIGKTIIPAGESKTVPVPKNNSGITLNADPSGGYAFIRWILGSTADRPAATEFSFDVEADMSIEAVFESRSATHTLTVESTAGGDVSWYYTDGTGKTVGGVGEFSIPDVSVYFTAEPGTSAFDHWSNGSLDDQFDDLIEDDYEIKAYFYSGDGTDGSKTITVTVVGDGTVEISFLDEDDNPVVKTADVTHDTFVVVGNVTFKAIDGTAAFDHWTFDDKSTSDQPTLTGVAVTNGYAITAYFYNPSGEEDGSYTIDVKIEGDGYVRVTFTDKDGNHVTKDVTADGTVTVYGDKASFEAVAGEGAFDHWSTGSTEETITDVDIDDGFAITAYFYNPSGEEDGSYTIDVKIEGDGYVRVTFTDKDGNHVTKDVTADGTVTVYGDKASFEAVAGEGAFDHWSTGSTEETITDVDIDDGFAITAYFYNPSGEEDGSYTIDVKIEGDGYVRVTFTDKDGNHVTKDVTADGTVTVYGDKASFEAVAGEGAFDHWSTGSTEETITDVDIDDGFAITAYFYNPSGEEDGSYTIDVKIEGDGYVRVTFTDKDGNHVTKDVTADGTVTVYGDKASFEAVAGEGAFDHWSTGSTEETITDVDIDDGFAITAYFYNPSGEEDGSYTIDVKIEGDGYVRVTFTDKDGNHVTKDVTADGTVTVYGDKASFEAVAGEGAFDHWSTGSTEETITDVDIDDGFAITAYFYNPSGEEDGSYTIDVKIEGDGYVRVTFTDKDGNHVTKDVTADGTVTVYGDKASFEAVAGEGAFDHWSTGSTEETITDVDIDDGFAITAYFYNPSGEEDGSYTIDVKIEGDGYVRVTFTDKDGNHVTKDVTADGTVTVYGDKASFEAVAGEGAFDHWSTGSTEETITDVDIDDGFAITAYFYNPSGEEDGSYTIDVKIEGDGYVRVTFTDKDGNHVTKDVTADGTVTVYGDKASFEAVAGEGAFDHWSTGSTEETITDVDIDDGFAITAYFYNPSGEEDGSYTIDVKIEGDGYVRVTFTDKDGNHVTKDVTADGTVTVYGDKASFEAVAGEGAFDHWSTGSTEETITDVDIDDGFAITAYFYNPSGEEDGSYTIDVKIEGDGYVRVTFTDKDGNHVTKDVTADGTVTVYGDKASFEAVAGEGAFDHWSTGSTEETITDVDIDDGFAITAYFYNPSGEEDGSYTIDVKIEGDGYVRVTFTDKDGNHVTKDVTADGTVTVYGDKASFEAVAGEGAFDHWSTGSTEETITDVDIDDGFAITAYFYNPSGEEDGSYTIDVKIEGDGYVRVTFTDKDGNHVTKDVTADGTVTVYGDKASFEAVAGEGAFDHWSTGSTEETITDVDIDDGFAITAYFYNPSGEEDGSYTIDVKIEGDGYVRVTFTDKDGNHVTKDVTADGTVTVYGDKASFEAVAGEGAFDHWSTGSTEETITDVDIDDGFAITAYFYNPSGEEDGSYTIDVKIEGDGYVRVTFTDKDGNHVTKDVTADGTVTVYGDKASFEAVAGEGAFDHWSTGSTEETITDVDIDDGFAITAYFYNPSGEEDGSYTIDVKIEGDGYVRVTFTDKDGNHVTKDVTADGTVTVYGDKASFEAVAGEGAFDHWSTGSTEETITDVDIDDGFAITAYFYNPSGEEDGSYTIDVKIEGDGYVRVTFTDKDGNHVTKDVTADGTVTVYGDKASFEAVAGEGAFDHWSTGSTEETITDVDIDDGFAITAYFYNPSGEEDGSYTIDVKIEGDGYVRVTFTDKDGNHVTKDVTADGTVTVYGDKASFEAVAGEGAFDHWSTGSTEETITDVDIDDGFAITAYFYNPSGEEDGSYTIDVKIEGDGYVRVTFTDKDGNHVTKDVTADGTVTVYGDKASFEAVAGEGAFDHWSTGSTEETITDVDIDDGFAITAYFYNPSGEEDGSYTIDVKIEGDGYVRVTFTDKDGNHVTKDVTADGTVTVYGDKASFEAVAGEGAFDHWSTGSTEETITDVDIDDGFAITAYFYNPSGEEDGSYTIDVKIEGDGYVRVTFTDKDGNHVTKDVTADGTVTVYGDKASFEAVAGEGAFDHWSTGSTEETITDVDIDDGFAITAYFYNPSGEEDGSYTIDVKIEGDGYVRVTFTDKDGNHVTKDVTADGTVTVYGDKASFEAVAGEGAFDHWSTGSTEETITDVDIDDGFAITAYFYNPSGEEDGSYTIDVKIEGDGYVRVTFTDKDGNHVTKDVTADGTVTVYGDKASFEAVAGEGAFDHWSTGSTEETITDVDIDDGFAITAYFYNPSGEEDGSYTISITIEGKGTVSLTFEDKDGNPVTKSRDTTGQLVVYGGDVSFKAEGNATEGYTFSRWFGAFQDTISQKTFEVDDNISITAKFVGTGIGGSYTITVDVTGSGSVTVTINGIEFDYVMPIIVESGAEISFKATPTGTTMFSHWVITGDQNPILYNPYPNNGTIAIDSDMFVNAYFVASGTEYTITPSVKNNQGGTTDPAVPTSVSLGGSLTITFSNDSGWHIVAIVVDGGQRQIWTDLFFTFEDVISNHTIEVEFESDPYIYAHAGDNGTIDPYGNVTVTAGSVPEFRITADRGYTIDVVTVIIDNNPETSGTLSGSGRDWTYTFDPIENNRIYEIYVTFKIDTSLYYAVTVTADAGGDASITTNIGKTIIPAGESKTVPVPKNNSGITLNADPSGGYAFIRWILGSTADRPAATEFSFDVEADMSIEAVFESRSATHTLTVESTAGGDVSWYYTDGTGKTVGGVGEFSIPDVSVYFTAEPGTSAFDHWSNGSLDDQFDDLIEDDYEIKAYFYSGDGTDGSKTITVTVVGDGTVEISFLDEDDNPVVKTADVTHDTFVMVGNVTFKAIDGTAAFDHWTFDDKSTSDQPTLTGVAVTNGYAITAYFSDVDMVSVTVNVTGNGSVDVVGDDGTSEHISADGTLTLYVLPGTVLEFIATDSTDKFVYWTITGMSDHPASHTYGKTISSVITIDALFMDGDDVHEVVVTAGENGEISWTYEHAGKTVSGVEGTFSVPDDADMVFVIEPANGYVIDIMVVGSAGKVEAEWDADQSVWKHKLKIEQDETIHVTFSAGYYIMASADANGTIGPSGIISVAAGGSQTFTITPDDGYVVSSIIVDGVTVTMRSDYRYGSDTYVMTDDGTGSIRTIHVTFGTDRSVEFDISVNVNGDGGSASITDPAAPPYHGGDVMTVTMVPNEGYVIKTVTDNGIAVDASGIIDNGDGTFSYVFEVHEDHDIAVTFVSEDGEASFLGLTQTQWWLMLLILITALETTIICCYVHLRWKQDEYREAKQEEQQ